MINAATNDTLDMHHPTLLTNLMPHIWVYEDFCAKRLFQGFEEPISEWVEMS